MSDIPPSDKFNRRGFLKGTAVAAALSACGPSVRRDCNADASAKECAPALEGLPDGPWFAQVASDLTAATLGSPQIVIDLDRLDHNADEIVRGVGADRYRIVEKSLPSLELLSYVSERTGSQRFMVMHFPFLPDILRAFRDADVMAGKPQPIAAVRQVFAAFAPVEHAGIAARVRFLADSVARAQELVALAQELGVVLQIAVDIDVGLHRGGVRRPSALPPVLKVIADNPDRAVFAGMLGYDGHVPETPSGPGLEQSAALATWRSATATYESFVDVVKTDFPELWRDDLVINSGGTQTYSLYTRGPVNDVSCGGGMLRPGAYANTFISALQPAIFLAAPVIATFDTLELPFVKALSESLFADQHGFTMYGGGWPAAIVWPPGVDAAPIVSDTPGRHQVPNQSWMTAPKSLNVAPGDWIFHHPAEADAMFQFQYIRLVRGGRLSAETWRPFPSRY